jgi:hypothetical protein
MTDIMKWHPVRLKLSKWHPVRLRLLKLLCKARQVFKAKPGLLRALILFQAALPQPITRTNINFRVERHDYNSDR